MNDSNLLKWKFSERYKANNSVAPYTKPVVYLSGKELRRQRRASQR